MEIKTEEEEEEMKNQSTAAGPEGKAKPERDLGRLVMTVSGVQKQLPFSPNDLLSTATMLDGDKVSDDITTLSQIRALPVLKFLGEHLFDTSKHSVFN